MGKSRFKRSKPSSLGSSTLEKSELAEDADMLSFSLSEDPCSLLRSPPKTSLDSGAGGGGGGGGGGGTRANNVVVVDKLIGSLNVV